jgi:hypothetical protein
MKISVNILGYGPDNIYINMILTPLLYLRHRLVLELCESDVSPYEQYSCHLCIFFLNIGYL